MTKDEKCSFEQRNDIEELVKKLKKTRDKIEKDIDKLTTNTGMKAYK